MAPRRQLKVAGRGAEGPTSFGGGGCDWDRGGTARSWPTHSARRAVRSQTVPSHLPGTPIDGEPAVLAFAHQNGRDAKQPPIFLPIGVINLSSLF